MSRDTSFIERYTNEEMYELLRQIDIVLSKRGEDANREMLELFVKEQVPAIGTMSFKVPLESVLKTYRGTFEEFVEAMRDMTERILQESVLGNINPFIELKPVNVSHRVAYLQAYTDKDNETVYEVVCQVLDTNDGRTLMSSIVAAESASTEKEECFLFAKPHFKAGADKKIQAVSLEVLTRGTLESVKIESSYAGKKR